MAENHLEAGTWGCQPGRDPLMLHFGDASQDTVPTSVASGRHRWRQHISSSILKPGLPHHDDRRPLLLFPTSRVVPQVLAFLGLFSEAGKQCEEENESQNNCLPFSHSAVMVQLRDGDTSLCLTQSCGQPAQPRLRCAPQTQLGDFLRPGNLVSLGCWSPSSPSSSPATP